MRNKSDGLELVVGQPFEKFFMDELGIVPTSSSPYAFVIEASAAHTGTFELTSLFFK